MLYKVIMGAMGTCMVGLLLLIGFLLGTIRHEIVDHDVIVEQVLGEAECVRMDWIASGPRGISKVQEQQLCGYHLEWGTPIGGVPSKPFAPQPDEHRLDGG